jgi:hypothetical protein
MIRVNTIDYLPILVKTLNSAGQTQLNTVFKALCINYESKPTDKVIIPVDKEVYDDIILTLQQKGVYRLNPKFKGVHITKSGSKIYSKNEIYDALIECRLDNDCAQHDFPNWNIYRCN